MYGLLPKWLPNSNHLLVIQCLSGTTNSNGQTSTNTPEQLWPLRLQGDKLGRIGLGKLQAIVAREKGENAGPIMFRVDMYSVLEKHSYVYISLISF